MTKQYDLFSAVQCDDRLRLGPITRFPFLNIQEVTYGTVAKIEQGAGGIERTIWVTLDDDYDSLAEFDNELAIDEDHMSDIWGNLTIDEQITGAKTRILNKWAPTPLRDGLEGLLAHHFGIHGENIVDEMGFERLQTLLHLNNDILRSACLDILAQNGGRTCFTDDSFIAAGHRPYGARAIKATDRQIIEWWESFLMPPCESKYAHGIR